MSSIEQKEEFKGNKNNVKLIMSYRQKVEEELSKICVSFEWAEVNPGGFEWTLVA
ncbi:hypothetical protein K1719_004112 [Acacia pycnantha]|nr:hypothetical protein K1719_004112 [Acacia pycnantha]